MLSDGSMLVVEGVPAAAVAQRFESGGTELVELDMSCWGQRWDRRETGEELSDVRVLYGDAALVHLVRSRSAGIGVVADANYSNVYQYTDGEQVAVLFDLRPQAIILLIAYKEHPLPEFEELVSLLECRETLPKHSCVPL